jgi:hypothetical protein
MPDFPLEPDERAALCAAFDSACEELGIGELSLDVPKRERVAQLILAFVCKGEHDVDVLHRRAVFHFSNTCA